MPLCNAAEAASDSGASDGDHPGEALPIDIHVGDQLDEAQLALSDSDEDGEPQGEGAAAGSRRPRAGTGPVPGRSVFDLVAHGRRPSGVPQPHPEPRPPRPQEFAGPRPAPERRAAPVFEARRDFRTAWPKFLHSECSSGPGKNYLRVSTTLGKHLADLRAVCNEHPGEVCSLSRSCRGCRPLWLLWWWFGQGNGKTKKEHQWPNCEPTREQRVSARAAFEALDDIDEFVDAEAGGRGMGEPA